ncbi:tetratricopeptide repeat protein [Ferribacterium limneticum]|uniref:tetratricopeptide repeat protein n=1 Tax=Ferribacterium limneticum TaxID=76259 RepID=UPI001CF89028|nr:hypothetical protein [Ferribacterium limneticum]UCV24515.1 sel1 repeat family protein [Ferribacterium limneticum]
MRHSAHPHWRRLATVLMISGTMATTQAALAGNPFCGGAATPGDPSDLANVIGDQTLEYAIQQPANIVTCAKGYLLEKCGDHENAHKIFDKCIAAGYAGAMIWKALLLEDGAGVKADLTTAAELMHRAATSGDPAYGPLGKMHYATMLQQGKGVPRDEAAARQWFEAAAAEGSEEARNFLRTGYHTGERDQKAMGAGTPPPSALVRGLTGDNASIPKTIETAADATVNREKTPNLKIDPVAKFFAEENISPPTENAESASDLVGQKLSAVKLGSTFSPPAESLWMALLLMFTVAAGILRQRAKAPRHHVSDGKSS